MTFINLEQTTCPIANFDGGSAPFLPARLPETSLGRAWRHSSPTARRNPGVPDAVTLLAVLRAHPVFRGVPVNALAPLLQNGRVRHIPGAASLCQEGDRADFWWFLLKGELELLRHGADGEERMFGKFTPRQIVAPVLMFAPGGRMPVSARARGACAVLQMRRQDLHYLCARIAQVAQRLLEMASDQLCRQFEEIEALSRGNAAQRLATWLLRQHQDQGLCVELPMSQRQLAATLGIRPETLSRLLSNWRSQGILEGRRHRWTITNPQTLAAL